MIKIILYLGYPFMEKALISEPPQMSKVTIPYKFQNRLLLCFFLSSVSMSRRSLLTQENKLTLPYNPRSITLMKLLWLVIPRKKYVIYPVLSVIFQNQN